MSRENDRMVSPDEMATRLGLSSKQVIYNWRSLGRVPEGLNLYKRGKGEFLVFAWESEFEPFRRWYLFGEKIEK